MTPTIKSLLKNIMDEVEFYYGDCDCDHLSKCKYCGLRQGIKDILEVELNNEEEKTNE
jgi:hypothetical protein